LFFFSFLIAITNNHLGHRDLDLGGLSFASLVFAFFAITCDPPSCNPHVDRHLPFPHSWLQLLMTILVVMIVISVVQGLHLLCLQLLITFLVMVFMLIIIYFSSFLVTTINDRPDHHDIDLSGPNLASLVLATIHGPHGYDPHVDHHFPFPPSWLQLLLTLLVIVIFIFMVLVVVIGDPPSCGLGCS